MKPILALAKISLCKPDVYLDSYRGSGTRIKEMNSPFQKQPFTLAPQSPKHHPPVHSILSNFEKNHSGNLSD